MRLLSSTTLEFKLFNDEELPPYAILSHTWGDEEISFLEQRFLQKLATIPIGLRENGMYIAALQAAAALDGLDDEGTIRNKHGYQKIEQTARLARTFELEWFWVDTCCIDKSSSAELQEAINSMYRWYKMSSQCLVVLEDVSMPQSTGMKQGVDQKDFSAVLRKSRWITRGWTLQELLAPSAMTFYDMEWREVTTKKESISALSEVTGIPQGVLATGDLTGSSVAQKMSWATKRTTSRVEDIAYSLLGIFNIHMPMLYGERENAFTRLQEEILRTSSDDSIFAWTAADESCGAHRGLLARSLSEFENSRFILRGGGYFEPSKMGVRVNMFIRPLYLPGDEDLYLGQLFAYPREVVEQRAEGDEFAIVLRKLFGNDYARVFPNQLRIWSDANSEYVNETVCVEHTPRIMGVSRSSVIKSLQIRPSNRQTGAKFTIRNIRSTGDIASMHQSSISILRSVSHDKSDLQTLWSKDCLVACVSLVRNDSTEHRSLDTSDKDSPIFILIAYDPGNGKFGCKILKQMNHSAMNAPVESWPVALREECISKKGTATEALYSLKTNLGRVYTHIEYAQSELHIAAEFDGLLIEPSAIVKVPRQPPSGEAEISRDRAEPINGRRSKRYWTSLKRLVESEDKV